jgi:DNA-binding NarL/FixJ family response regulator
MRTGEKSLTTIYLLDDHPLVIEALRAMIGQAEDLSVVGSSTSGVEAMREIPELLPNIVVADLGMPELPGEEVIRWLRSTHPDIAIIVLTARRNLGTLRPLVDDGVLGVIGKTAVAGELLNCIRTVAAGEVFLEIEQGPNDPGSAASADTLSNRELEVLQMVARGLSGKEIAAQLGIAAKTAETHKARGLVKLGLFSRSDIFQFAHREGWLDNT